MLDSTNTRSMALMFTNTRTRNKELFQPIQEETVGIYTCGPTVYNVAHIGNFMAYLDADLLQRYLRHWKGYRVQWVMNITDVDDKTIRDSKTAFPELSPKDALMQFTQKYESLFLEDLQSVGIDRSDIAQLPRATEHIPQMQEMINAIAQAGYAYEKDGSVYFNVQKYHDDGHYGELLQIDFSGFRAGVRIDADEYAKDHVQDFVLWKGAKEGEPQWEYTFANKALPGRPGWHIECSAMSSAYLGKQFDIHTGGVDLLFPHHENEIAQSTAANGVRHANTWLHNEHLQVGGKKMAKRDGNFYTIRDILARGFSGKAFRMLVISAHYRSKLNFTFDILQGSVEKIERVNEVIRKLQRVALQGSGAWEKRIGDMAAAFEAAMDDDLNTPVAWAAIFTFITELNAVFDTITEKDAQSCITLLGRINRVMNVFTFGESNIDAESEALLAERATAREAKNYALSDRLRDQLLQKGIVVEDTSDGQVWKRV